MKLFPVRSVATPEAPSFVVESTTGKGHAIGLSIARAGNTGMEASNVAGPRVAQLMDRTLLAGRHDVRTDGRSAIGRTVASGTSRLRLESAEFSGTRKVLKIE